ncbi:2-hydroxyacid dehydrogenase [Georgenia deserti]|uniref:2-hydroxyacid dehydrogenase n=1 Tax=Georgenia deserti TaxID=2093781 RepID=A0ABW4L632_9MICO
MHVVVADRSLARFAPALEQHLPEARWSYPDPADAGAVEAALADAEVFVGGRYTAAMATAAPKLRLVHAAGAGTDAIDVDALPPHVAVANVYEHERSMGEHVLMVMLALSRRLLTTDRALRHGRWLNPNHDPGVPLDTTLAGRSVGIVGYGHIGREVARLASAFEMTVRAVRRRPRPGDEEGLDFLGGEEALPQLLAESDFLVVCVPLSEHTRGLIGAAELARMRSTACLINVARGPVVDEEALYEALRSGRIAGAGLDVWYQPPPEPGHRALPAALPFGELDNVVLTPHNSGVTEETFRRRADVVGENLARLARGEDLTNLIREARS